MIVFDLVCTPGGHRFEGWFAGSRTFADQRARGLLMCPTCGTADVDKALMAPRLARKGNQGAAPPTLHSDSAPGNTTAPAMNAPTADDPRAAAISAMLSKVAAMQAEMLPKSTWVGRDFADTARAMHDGSADPALIHGQTTAEEAEALHADGIGILPLIVPFVPPEAQN